MMDRRDFIKSSLLFGGGLCAGFACTSVFNRKILDDIIEQNPDSSYVFTKDTVPKQIQVEGCNLCQLNCVKCWMRANEANIKAAGGFGYLKFKDFKKLVDENELELIELAKDGEIFLNPELNEIIKYAYEKNVKLEARSGVNLNTLSEETAENLVKYQFRHLTVSIDGATPEVYKIYRQGGDLNKVFDNIRMINKFKEQYNSPYPEMDYKMIIFGHNEHEIELAAEKAKELNMNIVYDENLFPSYSPVKDLERVYRLTGLRLRDPNKNYDIPFKFDSYNVQNECGPFLQKPAVEWNGTLLGCCAGTFFNNYGVNVFKEGVLNALNKRNVVYARRMITNLSLPKLPNEKISCNHCFVYDYMKEANVPYRIETETPEGV